MSRIFFQTFSTTLKDIQKLILFSILNSSFFFNFSTILASLIILSSSFFNTRDRVASSIATSSIVASFISFAFFFIAILIDCFYIALASILSFFMLSIQTRIFFLVLGLLLLRLINTLETNLFLGSSTSLLLLLLQSLLTILLFRIYLLKELNSLLQFYLLFKAVAILAIALALIFSITSFSIVSNLLRFKLNQTTSLLILSLSSRIQRSFKS